MFNKRPYRSQFLVQWNVRQCTDNPEGHADKVIEAILHQQGIQFEHTSEYRDIYYYDKLLEQLEHYDRKYSVNKEDPYLKFGLSSAYRIFGCPDVKMKLKPVRLDDAVANLYSELGVKGDKSAGLTAYGASKAEAFTVGLDKAIDILQNNKAPAPCLAGVRTQRKEKTRLVWGYPLEMTIIEAVVARPLIDYFKGTEHVMSFGSFSHELGMRMRRSESNNKYHYSIDYQQFDSTIGPLFIHYAFNAIRSWFNLEDKIYEEVTVADVLDRIESYFVTTPIVMPARSKKYPTMVTGKRGGVPSGSYFTQLVDSFVNVAIIYSVSRRFSLGLRDQDVYVLGDDCLFFCNNTSGERLLQQISSFTSKFGFKVSASKCSHGLASAGVEYLGRTWHNGFPLRSMSKVIRGALYPEKYRRYARDHGIRQKQAMQVVHSYLLTSYIEDPTVGIETLSNVYHITPWMTSGLTEYLLRSGLMPGDVLGRAVF